MSMAVNLSLSQKCVPVRVPLADRCELRMESQVADVTETLKVASYSTERSR